jgi:hypothetical protein
MPEDWAKRMNDALKELNEAVYAGGTESLTNTPGQKPQGDDESSGNDTSSPSSTPDSDAKKPKSSDDNP